MKAVPLLRCPPDARRDILNGITVHRCAPWLVYEGPDCAGKSTLLRAYHADRRSRNRPDLLCSDRLTASAAVYPRLRGWPADEAVLRRQESWLQCAGGLVLFCCPAADRIDARRTATVHPTYWPITAEIRAFEEWLRPSVLPVLLVDTGAPLPELVTALRDFFE